MRTTHGLLILLAISGCDLPAEFPGSLEGYTTSDSLRLATAVHLRDEPDRGPVTSFVVRLTRDGASGESSIADGEVLVGAAGESPVTAVWTEDADGGHYVAELDHWVDEIQVHARAGDDEAAITRAELLSAPDEMAVELPDVVTVGASQELRWLAQGRPINPGVIVSATDPTRYTLIALPIYGTKDDGVIEIAAEAFPAPGAYVVNFLRTVDYEPIASDSYSDLHVSLTATSYWYKRVRAAPGTFK